MNALTQTSFPLLLRRILLADAAATAATGFLLVFGGGMLRDLLGMPVELMRYSGVSLLPFAALVLFAATRRQPLRPLIRAIIVANALWAIDSFVLLASGIVTPTLLGTAFVAAQAIVVGAFAVLQYAGLRQVGV
jgi:hypothetical protein